MVHEGPMTWFSKFRFRHPPEEREGHRGRAQRYSIHLPVHYRCRGEREWHRGITENISCTGLLFRGDELLRRDTPVEISFSLPPEITGRTEVRVACAGYIVRTVAPSQPEEPPLLAAAAILDYRVLYGEQRPEAALEKAAQQERARQWAAEIGRRFQEQLAIVVGNSEIVLSHPGLPEPLRRNLEQAKTAALRAAVLIEELAKPEGERL